jgi:RNase P subunit RPR2
LKLREETFLKVFRQILVRIEAEALEKLKRCERCGEVLVHNGHEDKKIRTLLGSMRIARVRLCCQSCGEERYPLDEAIGLEAGDGTSLGVRERALWAAIELSYEKTASFLKKFTG